MATDLDECTLSVATLLGRVRATPRDQAAWAQFVERYGPSIRSWCRQRGLQDFDAEDVTQDVLIRIADKLQKFEYDPSRSFRGWLHTVTRNAVSDFLSGRRLVGQGGPDVPEALLDVAAPDDLVARLDAQFDQEVVEQACARVRSRIEPQTWDAFLLTAFEGLSGDLAGERLGMSASAVFKAKSRVLAFIRDEVARMDAGDDA